MEISENSFVTESVRKMRRRAMIGFDTLASQWQLKIEHCLTNVIRDLDGSTNQKPFRFFTMSEDNRARLLNLRTLLIAEHLPLEDILKIILKKYRKGAGSSSNRLGIRVANLTGVQALKVAIADLHTGENAWKVQERLKQISALVALGKLSYDNPSRIATEYFENLDRVKAKMQYASITLSRRAYRWNPWR